MIAITNGKVITVTGEVLESGTVLVEGGRIVAVGEFVEVPEDAEVFDATGKVVTPGLIDAHCHAAIFADGVGWGESDGNEMTDPITPHLRALDAVHPEDLAFKDLVNAGVTTVNIGPGSANLIGGQWVCVKTNPKPSIEEMILLEPSGMKMALGENPKRVYGEQKRMPATRMGNAAVLRSALVDAENYRQKWLRYEADLQAYQEKKDKEDDAKEPTAPERNLKWESLVRVLNREMKARIHSHRADDILTAIRISEEFNLDFTIEHATEGYKIADILAEKDVPVVVGPIFLSRMKYELVGLNPKNPGVLSRAGVKVAIQTDEMSAVKYLTYNAALAVREGMPEEEAFKAITITAAEIIGVDDRVGSLETGKDADIVVFNGDPFDYHTKPELVIVNGEVAYRKED
ncbi:MAG: amidohydrolase [Anaerolineaceae bacterium]|nr:amidohydrolase [Anaerolineaceae bacterium]